MKIVIGAQYYQWNTALKYGFWPCVTGVLVNGLGYICLGLCLSEMSSTLPFSGGIYGFVRAFVGPYSGYIVSHFEILSNVCRVASVCLMVGKFPTYAGISSEAMEPAWWCLMFGFAMIIGLVGSISWKIVNILLGSGSLILLIVYICGSFAFVDYETNVVKEDGIVPFTGENLMHALQYTSPMFLGIQHLPLLSVRCYNVSIQNIPIRPLLNSFYVLWFSIDKEGHSRRFIPWYFYLSLVLYLPLSYGFAKMFHIPYTHAIWLSLHFFDLFISY